MQATISLTSPPKKNTALRRFMSHRLAMFGVITITFLVLACAFGPWLISHNDTQVNIIARFTPPFNSEYWLGTDQLGRDILARLLMAGRISLAVGFGAMLLSMLIGVLIGLIAGYFGGTIGTLLMRFVDAILCFPTIFLLLALAAFIKPNIDSIIFLLAATGWMEVARIVEAQVRSLKTRDFTVASVALGASNMRIIFKELLPNAIAPIVVAATLSVAHAILMESYISFLGYGIQPPTPSWGNMLGAAQSYLSNAPWLALLPGLMITLSVTSINFIGDGLRDALDPRAEVN